MTEFFGQRAHDRPTHRSLVVGGVVAVGVGAAFALFAYQVLDVLYTLRRPPGPTRVPEVTGGLLGIAVGAAILHFTGLLVRVHEDQHSQPRSEDPSPGGPT